MKKFLAILLAAMFILSLAACGEKNETPAATDAETATEAATENSAASESGEAVSGGWTVNEELSAVTLPDKVQKAFDSVVTELKGFTYLPVAYLGSQVVAGTNYAVLCRATPETDEPVVSYLRVMIIYVDLDEKAQITNVDSFIIDDYTQGEGKAPEQLSGGWQVPETITKSPMSADAQTAFDKATANLTGRTLDPMALLGTQVVAGTNYAILCCSAPDDENGAESLVVATVYADLEGNAEVSNICTVDIGKYNK